MILLFGRVHMEHIHREHNMEADTLSKRGIGCIEGVLQVEEVFGGEHQRNIEHRIY